MGDIIETAKYETVVTVQGGRVGHAASEDGLLSVDLARPGSRSGTNPEQLLGAGWGACFLSTMQAIARNGDLDLTDARVNVRITLGTTEEGHYAVRAAILVDTPKIGSRETVELIAKAHDRCPYSRAFKNNIQVELGLLEESSR